MSPSERQEGRSIVDDVVRHRFLARKAFCRRALAGYLGTAPERILFARGTLGKPGLSLAMHGAGLQFNASSSGPLAVLAVARGISVGIDVEMVRPSSAMAGVSDWLDESFGNEAADAGDDAALFRRWTRLEARAKCEGDGLALHDGRDAGGWNFWSAMHRRASERFVLTLATRRAPRGVEGPFMFSLSSGGSVRTAQLLAHAAPGGA